MRKREVPWTKLDDLHRASLDMLVAKFGITGLTEDDLRHINLGWHRLNGWADSVSGWSARSAPPWWSAVSCRGCPTPAG